MAAPAPSGRNRYVDMAVAVLGSRLIKNPDIHAINALGYQHDQVEAEAQSPIVGVGITNTEDEKKIAFLTRAKEEFFSISDLLEYVEFPGAPYQVTDVGDITAAASIASQSTIQGGDSIRMEGGPLGSLACAAVEFSSKRQVLLSCNHIIADCNKGTRNKTPIICPANSATAIGVLLDFEVIEFGAGLANRMDAAICMPSVVVLDGLRTKGGITGILGDPNLNTEVEKEGAATGVTRGVLTIKNATLRVEMATGPAVFENQYAVSGLPSKILGNLGVNSAAFASHGDSGALVTDLQNYVVGMVFAVSSRVHQAYVTPIEPILIRFGLGLE
jgi:hypothetical protein